MSFLDNLRRGPKPKPTADPQARGASGRAHVDGFIELEELNNELRHPLCHQVFDKMYRGDGDVRQVVSLSVNPIVAGTWCVEPYGGKDATDRDREVAQDLQWALFEYMRPNLVGHLAQFLPVLVRSGFTPGEIVWALAERGGRKMLVPKTIELRLPRSIQRWGSKGNDLHWIEQIVPAGLPGTPDNPEQTQYGGGGGHSDDGSGTVRMQRRDLVYYRLGAEGDNWEGVSMLRPAYKHWYLKDRIEKIDAIAQEREAVGIPVAYPPPSASPKQLDEMEAILAAMRTNDQGYLMMPGMKAGAGAPEGAGWLIEILGFDRTGSGRDPQPSLQYHTNKIAAAFISEFMRLGHGTSGARATAQVQADPFLMAVEALTTIVEQELQDSLVLPFVAYNYPDVDNPPKLKMSLVDSTSLSQLADYVLKLTQVGAMLPDPQLEEFLRARAELPPSDAKAVKTRGDDDETIRRMIVGGNPNPTPADELAAKTDPFGGGGGNNPDPYGSNAKTGKHKNGKPAGPTGARKSGSPSGRGGAGTGAPRGAAKNLDDGAMVRRDFGRPLRPFEEGVALEEIEDDLDDAPVAMEMALRPQIMAMAREMPDAPPGELADTVLAHLGSYYDRGAAHVNRELGITQPTALDRGHLDRGHAALEQRAALAAADVHHAMHHAAQHADLTHGDDNPALAQAAAEQAGVSAARRAGAAHLSGAFMAGRHDAALDAPMQLGARYSAVLDRNTCGECELADDGEVRALDDPVRLDRRPPNHNCASNASGMNRCRCIEVYEPMGG